MKAESPALRERGAKPEQTRDEAAREVAAPHEVPNAAGVEDDLGLVSDAPHAD